MNNQVDQEELVKIHKSSWILLAFATIVVVVCAFMMIYRQQIVDYFAGRDYKPTAEMAELIKSLQLTESAEFILRATRPELQSADDFNINCPDYGEDTSTLGCYVSTGHIYLYDVESEELDGIHESVLAHELLHAIYARMGNKERSLIDREIESFSKAHKDKFSDYMASYEDDMYMTELHSIIGQRIRSSELTDVLREHYDKYFKNHDVVVAYYEKYHSKFEELKDRIAKLKDEIDKDRAVIEAAREAYNRHAAEVKKEIDKHNNRVDENSFSSYEESQRSYESAVKHRKELEDERLALNKSVDALNEKVKAVNSEIEHQSLLYRDINSKTVNEEKPVVETE